MRCRRWCRCTSRCHWWALRTAHTGCRTWRRSCSKRRLHCTRGTTCCTRHRTWCRHRSPRHWWALRRANRKRHRSPLNRPRRTRRCTRESRRRTAGHKRRSCTPPRHSQRRGRRCRERRTWRRRCRRRSDHRTDGTLERTRYRTPLARTSRWRWLQKGTPRSSNRSSQAPRRSRRVDRTDADRSGTRKRPPRNACHRNTLRWCDNRACSAVIVGRTSSPAGTASWSNPSEAVGRCHGCTPFHSCMSCRSDRSSMRRSRSRRRWCRTAAAFPRRAWRRCRRQSRHPSCPCPLRCFRFRLRWVARCSRESSTAARRHTADTADRPCRTPSTSRRSDTPLKRRSSRDTSRHHTSAWWTSTRPARATRESGECA